MQFSGQSIVKGAPEQIRGLRSGLQVTRAVQSNGSNGSGGHYVPPAWPGRAVINPNFKPRSDAKVILDFENFRIKCYSPELVFTQEFIASWLLGTDIYHPFECIDVLTMLAKIVVPGPAKPWYQSSSYLLHCMRTNNEDIWLRWNKPWMQKSFEAITRATIRFFTGHGKTWHI